MNELATVGATLWPTRATRLVRFVLATHPPGSYLLLTTLWCGSLIALFGGGEPVHFEIRDVLAIASFFAVLLYLRAVDEIKDLPYDAIHKRDRPLVSGAISMQEVAGLAAFVAAAIVVGNAWLAPTLAVFLAVDMAYGLLLLKLERYSQRFRDSVLLNLIVTFPVSAALNVYIYLYLGPRATRLWPVVLAHVLAFLHFEFGRKLKWPKFAAATENGYANALGTIPALAICLLLGTGACGTAMALHIAAGAPAWLAGMVWLAAVPSLFGVRVFFGLPKHRELKTYFALFLLLFFIGNCVVALVHRGLA